MRTVRADMLAVMRRLATCACALLAACAGPPPTSACVGGDEATVRPEALSKVDLLLVGSDASPTAAQPVAIVERLPLIVAALVTGDVDDDHSPDFAPVDLNVAVITSDLGVGAAGTPGCTPDGDGAQLRRAP